jgi:hypothetical protein
VLGLNQLCESLRRFHGSRFRELPLYCTLETYDYLRDHSAYEVRTALRFHEILPGTSFEIPGDTVRPVGVAHGTVKGAVVYVLQILNQTVIVGWDIDVPTAQVSAGRTNIDVFREDIPKGAEFLLMPANTWRAIGTGHTSLLKAAKYLEAVRPKTVAFVHLSGHEELRTNQKTGYGWTDRRWVYEIGKFAAEQEKFPRVVPVFQRNVLEVPVAVLSTPAVPGS